MVFCWGALRKWPEIGALRHQMWCALAETCVVERCYRGLRLRPTSEECREQMY